MLITFKVTWICINARYSPVIHVWSVINEFRLETVLVLCAFFGSLIYYLVQRCKFTIYWLIILEFEIYLVA